MKHGKRMLIGTLLLTTFLVNMAAPASAYSYTGWHWSSGSVSYKIDSSIPLGWGMPIYSAKCEWNNAGSSFRFSNSQSSTYSLFYGSIDEYIALTYFRPAGNPGPMTYCSTQFNSDYNWAMDGRPGYMDVQNIATHEFGHWLHLGDLWGATAAEKTMYYASSAGETKKRSLHSDDIAGIRYIYP